MSSKSNRHRKALKLFQQLEYPESAKDCYQSLSTLFTLTDLLISLDRTEVSDDYYEWLQLIPATIEDYMDSLDDLITNNPDISYSSSFQLKAVSTLVKADMVLKNLSSYLENRNKDKTLSIPGLDLSRLSVLDFGK